MAALVTKSSFQLLEALAAAVADEALAIDERVEAAAVTVRKLRPPIGRDIATVGVRVVRRSSRALTKSGLSAGPTARAFIGLGSNLGDRRAALGPSGRNPDCARRRRGGVTAL